MGVMLQSFGAAGEVTGSKHLLKAGDRKILVDCGMFQGKREESDEKNRNLPFKAEEIDAAVVFVAEVVATSLDVFDHG